MSEETIEFAVDQRVVYPSQGVGQVKEIFEKKVGENTVKYYKIYLEVSDMVVMIPVANAHMIGIRPIVCAEDAQKALELLGEEIEPVTSDWKLRYQMNLDLLKKGSIFDIVSIVRTLYHRSKVKELPILERKLYDNAKKLLEDEIAFALSKPSKEIEAMLHAKLEPLGALVTKKLPIIDEDEDDDDEFADEINDSDSDNEDSDDEEDSDEADSNDDMDDEGDDEE
ncbi:MAG: CarD family transcriptional regulator [Treponema sp.]|uniref:CarD family transcriptional regulator n=1 Tax=Treponema sp. TaxID=166 RepID=UPI001B5DF8BF|nr:CarD family transcriptional regulator [Treponema sp.]MBP3773644.1 CarD family transcriptional regulator [Treponema sp.]MBQ9282690.1 CarD family transcriptional regulator [Treponema sp.]